MNNKRQINLTDTNILAQLILVQYSHHTEPGTKTMCRYQAQQMKNMKLSNQHINKQTKFFLSQ